MDTENIMTLEEKCGYLWDYYKDCFGHRPRHFLPDFWTNETEVDAGIKRCDDWYDRMSATAEGRREMRADGWIVD